MSLRQRLQRIHRFFAQYAFYALVLSSMLATSILAARVIHFHSRSYIFLTWNLYLAWIPYIWSLGAAYLQQRNPRAWWRLLIPGILWLLFFPNAPYIVTDFVHLREIRPVPLWYDIGLLATFAWSGCFLAVVSLQIMQRVVRQYVGGLLSWLFVAVCIGLSGLGVYMGRYERWNSWDIMYNPRDVLLSVIRPMLYPHSHKETIVMSGMFAALLFICYVTFISVATHNHNSIVSIEK